MVGSWRVVVSADEVAIVTVIATIFSYVGNGGIRRLARWWDEVGLKSFIKEARSIKEAGSRNIQGCVSGEARLSGFLGSRIRS